MEQPAAAGHSTPRDGSTQGSRAPTPQVSIPGGGRGQGHNCPMRAGRQRGRGTSCSPGMSPALGPRSQGSGFPVPRQPEPGMAFQAQAFLHPAGLGARGGGCEGAPAFPGRRQVVSDKKGLQ